MTGVQDRLRLWCWRRSAAGTPCRSVERAWAVPNVRQLHKHAFSTRSLMLIMSLRLRVRKVQPCMETRCAQRWICKKTCHVGACDGRCTPLRQVRQSIRRSGRTKQRACTCRYTTTTACVLCTFTRWEACVVHSLPWHPADWHFVTSYEWQVTGDSLSALSCASESGSLECLPALAQASSHLQQSPHSSPCQRRPPARAHADAEYIGSG